MQGDVLDDLLFLVDLALWQGDVFFRFQVVFRGKGIGTTDALVWLKDRECGPRTFTAPVFCSM